MEEFKKQLKTLTTKLKEAEARAEYAEKTVKKLQKEVDRLEGGISSFVNELFLVKFLMVLQGAPWIFEFNFRGSKQGVCPFG